MLKDKGVSSELYYNLGNAYVKSGNLGLGMLNYQRSLRMDPSNSNCRNNIQYISSKIEDANKAETHGKNLSVAPEGQSFFSQIKNFICYSHLSDTWAIWSVVCFLLACIGIAAYLFGEGVMIRKIGFFGGGLTLGLSVITLVFSLMGASALKETDKGVICGYKVQLRKEPDSAAVPTATILTQGTVLKIQEIQEDNDTVKWYKVRLNSDFTGWISGNDFIPINQENPNK